MPSRHEPLITRREAAQKLGVSPRTIRRYELQGLLRVHKTPGGHCRYFERDTEALLIEQGKLR